MVQNAMNDVDTGKQLSFVCSLDFWRCDTGGQNGSLVRDLRQVIAVLADERGVNAEDIRRPSGRLFRHLRQVAIYLTNCQFGHPIKHVALALGLTKQAGSKSCHKIEDDRDDPEFDRWLCKLELQLEAGVAA